MKGNLLNSFGKTILCLLVALLSGGTAWAQDDNLYYTLDGTKTGGTSGYGEESSITQESISWGVVGNTTQDPWRIGGTQRDTEGNPTDRSITSKTAMGDPINKVEVSVGAISDTDYLTINSLTLTVASDANFSQNVQRQTINSNIANNTHTFNGNWPAGSYYKLTFNITITKPFIGMGTTIRYFVFNNAQFYSPLVATPVIEGNPEFTADEPANVSITCATPGATILYSINDGASWTQYTNAFTLTQSTTVMAKATKTGRTDSHETSKLFYLVSEKSTATWNLRIASYTSSGQNEVKWTTPSNGEYNANMTLAKGTSTRNANYRLGGSSTPYTTYNYTAFSQNQVLTIEPLPGYMILSVEIAMNNNPGGLTRTWTNATATNNGNTVTVIPNDGNSPISTTIYSDSRVNEVTVICAPAPIMVTIGFTHYSTLYYGDRSLRLPAGLEAYTYKLGTLKMIVSRTYANQAVIPAGEAVVLHGEPGTYSFIAKPATDTKDTANLLKGSDNATTTFGGDYYYALSIKKGSNDPSTIGFYWLKDNGGAFDIAAHKAWLPLDFTLADLVAAHNNAGGAKNYISLSDEEDPTGINEVEFNFNDDDVIYNLAGQRINKMQRGINIINGKKILK